MSRIEAAMQRAGALVVLAAASALVLLPAAHHVVVLALHAVLLLGCAAIQLARTVAVAVGESARAAAWLRWVGFAGVVLLYLCVAGDVRAEEASTLGKVVQGFLLFLVFLAAVWAIFLSMITGRPAGAAAVAEEDEIDGGEVNAMAGSIC